jgi:hypothetical protein
MSGIRLPITEEENDDDTAIESSNIEAILLRMLQDTPTNVVTTTIVTTPVLRRHLAPYDDPQVPNTPEVLRHRYDDGVDEDDAEGEGDADIETYDEDDMMIDYGDEGDLDHPVEPRPNVPRNTVEFVDQDAFVPCEMCREMIAFMDYARHLEVCGMRHNVYRNTLPSILNQDNLFVLPQRMENITRVPLFFRNVPMSVYESHDDTVAEIGLRLIQSLQSGNEYQYNLLMQELMGGPVRIGVPDVDAVCPVVQDDTVPEGTTCTICLSGLPIRGVQADDNEAVAASFIGNHEEVGNAGAGDDEEPVAADGAAVDDDSDDEQPIAADDDTGVAIPTRKTLCGHHFCTECICKWLADHKTCPNCLAVLSTS